MACNFSIDFPGSAQQLVQTAQSAIVSAGGKFGGDEAEGTFSLSTPLGRIKGEYQINNSTISINISDKPMLVGCSRIENELRKYLVHQAV